MDKRVADSAGTATAYLCGVKAKYSTIGVDGSAMIKRCDSVKKAKVDSILKWALDEGKSVGFVTTARATHASPAPLYAHAAYRSVYVLHLIPKNVKIARARSWLPYMRRDVTTEQKIYILHVWF